jgi:pimeloyl-ACP methyl ester carboxylesterase
MGERAPIRDTELAYEILGNGPPLVWCHGLASCIQGDRDVIDAFAQHFTVLAYDARGHGSSAAFRETDGFSYAALGEDALAMLEYVGWKSAILAGASMGAATLARVACLAPDLARALIMARPAAMGPDGNAPSWLQLAFAGGAHAIRQGGIDGAIEYLLTIPVARAAIEADPGRIEGLRRDWKMHDPLSIAAALEGIPRTGPLAGGLSSDMITCPSLVIPGNDIIHPTEAGIEVARLIPGCILAEPFDSLPRTAEVAGLVELVRKFVADL